MFTSAPAEELQAKPDLEHGQAGLAEVVEGTARLLVLEPATEYLHPQQGEDEDEKDQQDQ